MRTYMSESKEESNFPIAGTQLSISADIIGTQLSAGTYLSITGKSPEEMIAYNARLAGCKNLILTTQSCPCVHIDDNWLLIMNASSDIHCLYTCGCLSLDSVGPCLLGSLNCTADLITMHV